MCLVLDLIIALLPTFSASSWLSSVVTCEKQWDKDEAHLLLALLLWPWMHAEIREQVLCHRMKDLVSMLDIYKLQSAFITTLNGLHFFAYTFSVFYIERLTFIGKH